jgi:alkylhydroperoxidase family enzyme
MEQRMNYVEVAPGVEKAMLGLVWYLAHCGLERSLIDLISYRVSQINGCAY